MRLPSSATSDPTSCADYISAGAECTLSGQGMIIGINLRAEHRIARRAEWARFFVAELGAVGLLDDQQPAANR